jgi:hypothetical protein
MILAIAFSVINVSLTFLGQRDLAIYFIIDCIAYFVIILAFINLNPGAKGVLNRMSAFIFVAFLAIISLKVVTFMK